MQFFVVLDGISLSFPHTGMDGYFSFGSKRLDWYMV